MKFSPTGAEDKAAGFDTAKNCLGSERSEGAEDWSKGSQLLLIFFKLTFCVKSYAHIMDKPT